MRRVMLMSVLAFTTPMAGVNALADAGAQYKAGADFAKQVKGQGESSLKNFSPESSLPGYTATPGAQKYYGGVPSTGDGALKAEGIALNLQRSAPRLKKSQSTRGRASPVPGSWSPRFGCEGTSHDPEITLSGHPAAGTSGRPAGHRGG